MSESLYYKTRNFFNLTSDDTLTIIPRFKTYQQTTEYTCGPAVALMVAEHFGIHGLNESAITNIMGVKSPDEVKKDYGTSTKQLVSFFMGLGFITLSSMDNDAPAFHSPPDFREWVIQNLKANLPIMVDWADWGGHWQAIIGYDKLSLETVTDDVIIFADPYDTTDHKQDGYYIFSAERFFYMWFDSEVTQSHRQWVIAYPDFPADPKPV